MLNLKMTGYVACHFSVWTKGSWPANYGPFFVLWGSLVILHYLEILEGIIF